MTDESPTDRAPVATGVTSASDLPASQQLTTARVGLGRTGTSLPTSAHLTFQRDHARARDAVHAPFNVPAVIDRLRAAGLPVVEVATEAGSREHYLRDPDSGRRLDSTSRALLGALAEQQQHDAGRPWDVALLISDGLSATAAQRHAADLAIATAAACVHQHLSVAPIIVVPLARVGVLDSVGAALEPVSAAIILGERPGLSAADTLSAYFEYAPQEGCTDANRNCISNIRPGGLDPALAASQLAHLISAGHAAHSSGTTLKVEFVDPRLDDGHHARPQLDA